MRMTMERWIERDGNKAICLFQTQGSWNMNMKGGWSNITTTKKSVKESKQLSKWRKQNYYELSPRVN